MCDHAIHDKEPRYGARLEHEQAHTEDHRRWSRRDFLTSLGLAAGTTLLLGKTPVHAFAQSPLLAQLQNLESDRVLVIIQLGGGNDGLNTIVPIQNDIYYRARPRLAIAPNDTLPFNGDLGFHPSLAPLMSYQAEGQMAIVQGVGYPDPDLSHFRSTDIWMSGSDTETYLTTGWAGRSLDQLYPNFGEEPPTFPLAVQVGGLASLMFQGPAKNLGMTLTNPDLFRRLAEEGTLYDTTAVPATPYGSEMTFMRSVANDAFRYATAIQQAADAGENSAAYPEDNYFAMNMAMVARLIKGNLGARIYHIGLDGFDTHAEQEDYHPALLRELAGAVAAFQQDLAAGGRDGDVLTMTFSEFGRRIEENGSLGTDHGTAAPLFFFGPGVEGGLYGQMPRLDDVDDVGNVKFHVDFRAVYATVLQRWFGFETATVDAVLGRSFELLDFIPSSASGTPVEQGEVPEDFTLQQNYPNPFNPSTTISFTLPAPTYVRLQVYDVRGRLVQTLVDGMQSGGQHTLSFDSGNLPSGPYLYRLDAGGHSLSRKMLLLK